MQIPAFLRSTAWVFLGALALAAGARAATAERPNIVVILADDLGYGSVGCYGADPKLIATPNIDRLATEGMRFIDANTPASICTPTRYGVLTGRYCWRSRLKFEVANVFDPLLIEADRPTIASVLKARGYTTAAIGKWHLGYGDRKPVDYTKPLVPGPLELGFEYHFGVPQNNGDLTGVYVENRAVYGLRSNRVAPTGKKTFYGPPYLGLDAPQRDEPEVMPELTKRAVAWLREAPRNKPFFLYLAATAVHEPVWPSREVAGSSAAGAFGDFVHDLDKLVGRVLAALEEKGMAGNTLVIFTSDNGGVIVDGDGGKNASLKQAELAGLKMNGDWRGRKHSIYEGGFRVPFIARWPGHIAAGTENRQMVNLVDLFATVSELVGQPVSREATGGPDSISFLPLLLGATDRGPRDAMILHSAKGNFAIRQGRWKYIEGKPHPKVPRGQLTRMAEEYHPQLYDLASDPGERNDVLAAHPDVVARLSRLLDDQRNADASRDLAVSGGTRANSPAAPATERKAP